MNERMADDTVHLMNRPDDWRTATDEEWLAALGTVRGIIDPRFMAYAENSRPHVLRKYLQIHEMMGGYVGPPARRWLKQTRRPR